ncbi:MAG: BMC domain-containing protein [bacterium]|nr:BMC domain-containing protein [Planctomycetota bacterium]HIL53325.1 BMC domain-containing protein [Planctomycetota bacterium]
MPPPPTSLGMLELSSIGIAYRVEDAMLKAAPVTLLVARTICSGKYIVMVGGDTAAVEASVAAGREHSQEALIDDLVIPHVDPRLFPAISSTVELSEDDRDALGILEAFSVTAIIEGADSAVKAADVTLFSIHVAMAIGGKGFLLLTGSLSDVEAAISAGAAEIAKRGLLVSRVVIPRPAPELFREMI